MKKFLTLSVERGRHNQPLALHEIPRLHATARKTLESLIPDMSATHASHFEPCVLPVGDMMHFGFVLYDSPQLRLLLTRSRIAADRVIEISPEVLDQRLIEQSLQQTQLLLAVANLDDPEELRSLQALLRNAKGKRQANYRHRQLAQKLVLGVWGDRQQLWVPELPCCSYGTEVMSFTAHINSIHARGSMVLANKVATRAANGGIDVHHRRLVAVQFTPEVNPTAIAAQLGIAHVNATQIHLNASLISDVLDGELVGLRAQAIEFS